MSSWPNRAVTPTQLKPKQNMGTEVWHLQSGEKIVKMKTVLYFLKCLRRVEDGKQQYHGNILYVSEQETVLLTLALAYFLFPLLQQSTQEMCLTHWITQQEKALELFGKHRAMFGCNPALTPCSRHGPSVIWRIHWQAAPLIRPHQMCCTEVRALHSKGMAQGN